MENRYHKNREDVPEHGASPNHRSKPTRNNLGSPGDRKSYNRHVHEDIAVDRHSGENIQSFESFEADARRKDELSHAIFVKLQEVSRYNIEIGNYEEGLASYDRCIDHLLHTLPQGPSAPTFKDFLVKTVKYLNEVALKLLQEEKVKESLQLLERCLKMTHPNSFGPYPTLRSLTYNHLGCCYRRLEQLDKALFYLEKALKFPLDQDIEKVETSGITHINLCAVLSQLGDHKRALEHATRAVSDCSVELMQATKKDAENGTKTNTHKHVTMLAIAYHNLATEEEAFAHTEAALQAYLRAFNIIREYNPPHHELCVKFGRAYEEAKTRMSNPSFNKGPNFPSGFNKRYKTSSPHASNKVIVESPTSYNTSKPYLQNKKIVIPKRQGAPQVRPILASPSSIQLAKKPIFSSPSQRKIPRLVSAHPYTEIKRLELDKGDYGFSQVAPQRNKFMLGTPDSRTAQQRQQQLEQNNQEKKPRAVSAKANTRTPPKVDPAKVQQAVIKLQSFCRGRLARQYVGNVRAETPQQVYLVLVADTVKRNLETGPFSKENLYLLLMMYRLDSQLIHIHIKNLENKRFYRALVEYQVVDRSSNHAIRNKLREACERLIQRLEIHDDQIVFRGDKSEDEPRKIEDMHLIGQEVTGREAENVITQTTQRIDEQIDENRGSMGPRKNKEDLNSKKTKDVDKAAQTIQKHIRGKLTRDKYQIFRDKRFKVVFSKCNTIEGNVIGFRLVDRPDEEGDEEGTYDLCCYNFTNAKQYKKVEIPKKKLKLEKLSMEKLLKKVEVDVKNNIVTYKPKDKKVKKDIKEKKEKEKEEEKEKNERTPKKVHEKTPDKTRKRTPTKAPTKEVTQPTHKKKKKENNEPFFRPLDEVDIDVLQRYSMGPYATAINKVEEDSKNLIDAINKQIGIKESDAGLAPPSQWNLTYDEQLASEQPLHVARCTKVINPNTEDAKYLISIKQAAKYVVGLGEKVAATDVEEGMRVGVDKDKYQIQLPLPPRIDPSVTMMTVEERPDVTYNDVGGAKEQLERLREVIEMPLLNPEKFTELGIDPPKGVLLYGPPGTGKTLTARAVANRTEACFIRVIGSELVQKYVGEGARMVRELFQMARSKKACVIFFDEVDAIGGARFDDGAGSDNEVQRTMLEIVNQLDGFESRGNIKVLMATNRPDTLDPALLRPGRLDRKIEFGLPDLAGREHIFKIHARTMNMEKNIRFELLARLCPNATGADLRSVATEAGMYAIRARRKLITEKDMLDAIEKVIKGYSKFSATSKYMIYN